VLRGVQRHFPPENFEIMTLGNAISNILRNIERIHNASNLTENIA